MYFVVWQQIQFTVLTSLNIFLKCWELMVHKFIELHTENIEVLLFASSMKIQGAHVESITTVYIFLLS